LAIQIEDDAECFHMYCILYTPLPYK